MKNYFKMVVVPCLFMVLLALLPSICSAQLGDPAGDPDAPIDGGVGILIAAGIGYGIKKYKNAGKNKAGGM
jgi:hypothetical protein